MLSPYSAGPLFLAYLLNWGLFGVLSTQVYVYYLAFPKDQNRSKALVYLVYVFEMAQTVLLTQHGFYTFAENFGNVDTLDEMGTIWFSVPVMNSVVAFVVQIFYAFRIRILAQSYIVPLLVTLLASMQLGAGLAIAVFAKEAIVFSKYVDSKALIVIGIFGTSTASCDVLIAASMTYYLSRMESSYESTQGVIRKLIRLIIETGTLTATVAIINLGLSVLQGNLYYTATSGALGKLYSNTMMVVFNSRMKVGRASDVQLLGGGPSAMVVVGVESGQSTGIDFNHGGISGISEWAVELETTKRDETNNAQRSTGRATDDGSV